MPVVLSRPARDEWIVCSCRGMHRADEHDSSVTVVSGVPASIGAHHAHCGSDTETAQSAINFCADGSCEHSLAVDLIDDNYTVAHISIAK